MSTPAKPQNVCAGCRSRKKKCNGARPACSACVKRGELCVYGSDLTGAPPISWALAAAAADQPWHALSGDSDEHAGFPLGLSGEQLWMGLDGGYQIDTAHGLPSPQPQKSPSLSDDPRGEELPALATLLQIVDVFFERFYPYLPVVHRPTLEWRLQLPDEASPVLLHAICAVAAGAHPDRDVQRRQGDWFAAAKANLSRSMHSPERALQTMQAAVLVIYQATVETDFSTAWLVLGEAWRKAVAIGCSAVDVDAGATMTMPALGAGPGDGWVEREECRRVVWTLFVLDRGMCFPLGLVHAVDDRQLRLNLPMDDAAFQDEDEPAQAKTQGRFSPDLKKLISTVQGQQQQHRSTNNILHCLVLAYALLGRVGEQLYSSQLGDDASGRLEDLPSDLSHVRLVMPASATDLSAAEYQDHGRVVWIRIVMSACAILVHHRSLRDGEGGDESAMAANWPLCVAAARGTASVIRQTALVSTNYADNGQMTALLFMCCRVIITEHLCPLSGARSAAVRDDLEVLLLAIRRMRDTLKKLGEKFTRGVVFYLSGGRERAAAARALGAWGVLRTCEKWPTVDIDDMRIPP
ncbi:hypothetical protein JDV02_004254 [Purpureocillium takamizusanense]|uniref:Zn(2)-C6 fungal-type domain-containing protein n=1 Tax=Purpureocillium takamizusanense TaxID=2060973 RepID=A0A9Q8QE24_9HYPO|nr:uncharacterized protein JDV02_004254 [Purpureocillium takamizusanense]UNI17950.1 hypothetical protein JDV02_004254 [Purpureocillium takamizusanense]